MENFSYIKDLASDVLSYEVAEGEIASLAVALCRLAPQTMLFLQTYKNSVFFFSLNLVDQLAQPIQVENGLIFLLQVRGRGKSDGAVPACQVGVQR